MQNKRGLELHHSERFILSNRSCKPSIAASNFGRTPILWSAGKQIISLYRTKRCRASDSMARDTELVSNVITEPKTDRAYGACEITRPTVCVHPNEKGNINAIRSDLQTKTAIMINTAVPIKRSALVQSWSGEECLIKCFNKF